MRWHSLGQTSAARPAGAKFKKAADIDQMQSQISAQLTGTWWQGGSADKFRAQWNGDLRGQLTKLKTLLEATATTIARQAADQQPSARADAAATREPPGRPERTLRLHSEGLVSARRW